MKWHKGSLTIFAALSLMLIASVLFTLLEGARNIEMRRIAKMKTDASMESLFAGYEREFWETCHLLGVDCSDQNGGWSLEEAALFVEDIAGRTQIQGIDLLRIVPQQARITTCMLLTDGDGAVFEAATAAYMKEHLFFDTAEEIYRNYQSMEAVQDGWKEVDGAIEAGQEALKNLDEGQEENSQTKPDQGETSADNPMKEMEQAKKKGITALVLPENRNLSGKQIENAAGLLSKRERVTGMNPVSGIQNTWYDRVQMNRYLTEYMGNFRTPSENGELCYELEYLLSGKKSDPENIKAAFHKLVAMREAANLTYLLSDAQKMKCVSEIAALLAGTSANPVVGGAVELGILASWAYAESILDVRTLVNGGKIALVKNSAQWTCEAESIAEIASGYQMAKECENGMTYEQYLESMLLSVSERDTAFRAMDLMERSLQKLTECGTIRLDHFMVSAEIEMTYEWKGIFSPLIWIGSVPGGVYSVDCKSDYSYLNRPSTGR